MESDDEFDRAHQVLGEAGVRLMEIDGRFTIGIWSDLDSPTLRDASRVFHPEGMPPVCYLDDAGSPIQYKLRSVEGEPVPLRVLAEMQRNPSEPWKARDRMLKEMGWRPEGIPWAEWKAQELNELFRQHGTGGPGHITAATVQDGLNKTEMAKGDKR
jgi:hypothetical protein